MFRLGCRDALKFAVNGAGLNRGAALPIPAHLVFEASGGKLGGMISRQVGKPWKSAVFERTPAPPLYFIRYCFSCENLHMGIQANITPNILNRYRPERIGTLHARCYFELACGDVH
jgi:hypothetical protein